MSTLIVMESSSNSSKHIDTSIVNMNEEQQQQQQLLVLPEDIVFEILLWLPVDSLLRFKSVCKSWCSLIQNSRFISQHKDKATSRNNLLLMLPSAEEVGGHNVIFKLLSSCGNINNNNNKFQIYENLDLPEYLKINDTARMVTCDGLICLHHSLGADVSLWNPATKQFRILPRSQLTLPSPMYHNNIYMLFGFGFDVETNDYKVVRVAYLQLKSTMPFLPPRTPVSSANTYDQIEVYSLTNNSWKTLDFDLPIDCVFSDPKMPLPYHNGGIYCWMGRDRYSVDEDHDEGMPLILSFDFSKEIFGTISLPTFQHHNRRFPRLAILKEKLAAIKDIDFIYYQVWVMNEFGVRESWTKLYTVGPFSYSQPIGFPKNEDLFLLLKDKKQICSCDPVTGQINNLPALDDSFNVQAAVYKESLLPVWCN